MSEDMEKQRVTKDDGRYQIFYTFGAVDKQEEKETPGKTMRYNDHASTSKGGKK